MKPAAAALLLVSLVSIAETTAQPSPSVVRDVEPQPLAAQARRVIEAMEYLGEPFSEADTAAMQSAMRMEEASAVEELQRILDARVLFVVHINPEMRVKVAQGPARPELVEQGWRQFLVKVVNESGTTAALEVVSPNAQSVHNASAASTPSDKHYGHDDSATEAPSVALAPRERWLDLQTFDAQPLRPTLGGLPVEYRIVQLYSRDAGQREARFAFSVGQGTQDLGFRSEADVLFTCRPAREIELSVLDENGEPTTASFTIRDQAGRVHPSQAKRLAPDFAFHPQVYRADGETLRLPDGEYVVRFERGPESVPEERRLIVDAEAREWRFQVERWIDPAQHGWWSGDHHIHAAGCAHYNDPTQGVLPQDMARHTQGEDLKIGANLTWGPGFDYQKQFFTGEDHPASRYPYLLRYDIEVSGFGSHRSGHLCLLRLREQMYPGGDSKAHWPTLGLETLRWAKRQGAIAGPAHSGWGLQPAIESEDRSGGSRISGELRLATSELPNYIIPPYNGIGANEYIMDVTHEVPGPDGRLVPAVDFISLVDTPSVWELNMWYHTLNAGFRTRASGETDFPCIYGERVGLGRSYVKLDGRLSYDDWCEGIRDGRCYVSDGRSHLLGFTAMTASSPGERGPDTVVRLGEGGSELRLASPGSVRFTARVAARLSDRPDPELRMTDYAKKPYWHIERARIDDSREVLVEVIVNGHPVAQRRTVADGALREMSFDVPIERSSWVALRILPSSHTNPIWVLVGDQPVRMRRSIEWCLEGVDECWSQKEQFYAPAQLPQARLDYEHARNIYRERLKEAESDRQ
ncbi:MAG: CehA/McbA family metallohydrolase [Opitutaceae bacterium]